MSVPALASHRVSTRSLPSGVQASSFQTRFSSIIPEEASHRPEGPVMPKISVFRLVLGIAGQALRGNMGFALEFPRFWHEAFTLNKHLNQMVHGERPMTPNTLRDTVHGFQAIEGQAHHLARHLGAPKEGVTLDEALTRVFQAVGGKKAQIVAPASDAPLVGNRTMETMERQALRAGIQFRHVPLPRAFDELTDAVRLNANLPQALPTLQRLEQALKA